MTDTDTGGGSTITLGDVSFDPLNASDFRLSVEGTSNMGKSNSLAVILEDLSDVTIPTLIIERVGALTPVRLEDERIVVVGGEDAEYVDLVVPVDDIEQVGSWVLDDGLKVLLDVSTYEDYTDEKSRLHLAAATALRSLNNRAAEKYKSGERTRSLLLVDEAHYIAPKDSAPEPQIDEWVRRARGELIKGTTEGGNKGISTIVAYQRRAFLHNGVIQLCRDWVAHRPGDEDISRTADSLRCSDDILATLQTGHIVARGEMITDDELVGPTKVRKRTSPDPRDPGGFSLPDVPDELEGVVDSIQEDIGEAEQRRSEQQSRIEELEARVEELEAERDRLEEELADTDRFQRLLQRAVEGTGEGVSEEVQAEIERQQERIEALQQERDRLKEQVEKIDDALSASEDRVAELEAELAEKESIEAAMDEIEAGARSILSAIGRDNPQKQTTTPEGGLGAKEAEELRTRVAELEEENQRLRQQDTAASIPGAHEEFVSHPAVKEQIEAACNADNTSEKYVKGVLRTIMVRGEPVTRDQIASHLDVSMGGHISRAVNALEERNVVKTLSEGRKEYIDIAPDQMESVVQTNRRTEQAEKALQDI